MRVRVKAPWDWHRKGDIIDPPPNVARTLVQHNRAEWIDEADEVAEPDEVETAVVEPAEDMARRIAPPVRRGRGRPKGSKDARPRRRRG